MPDTVTIRRRQGAPAIERASSGSVDVEFAGPGPWTLDAATWGAIRSTVAEFFDLSPTLVPAPDAEEDTP